MNTQKLKRTKPWSVFMVLSFFALLSWLAACESNEIPQEKYDVYPPDPTKDSGIEYYSPDSGGVRTQLVLKGYNLGTDTSCLKVTVNGKNASIVGVNNDFVYAIVPARADTGAVKLYVTKNDQVQDFAYENVFRYKFVRNVTTYAGATDRSEGIVEGALSEARFRRPWFILKDSDDAMYVLDEGRGTDKNGALQRIREGYVETLYMNNSTQFRSPTALAFSPQNDTLYVVQKWHDGNDARIDGAVLSCTRDGGFVNMKIFVDFYGSMTTGIAVHPKTGDMFFNSQTDGYIYKYTGGGKDPKSYKQIYQINNATNTEIRLCFSRDGKTLYTVVRNRHCIFKSAYDETTGELSPAELWVGAWDESGYQNGVGGVARFNNPGQPCEDEDGNLYVPDKGNEVIRKITPDGTVSLFAGIPNTRGNKDGTPEIAEFREPEAVTVLSDGAVYVADRANHCIRRILVE